MSGPPLPGGWHQPGPPVDPYGGVPPQGGWQQQPSGSQGWGQPDPWGPPGPGPYPGPPVKHRTNRKGWAIAVGVCGVLVVTVGVVSGLTQADRGKNGEIVDSGEVNVFTLVPGDCYNDPADEEIDVVDAVRCDEPHDSQVIGAVDLPRSRYPTLSASQDHCDLQMKYWRKNNPRDYTRLEKRFTELSISTLMPLRDHWGADHHKVICSLHVDDGKLTEKLPIV